MKRTLVTVSVALLGCGGGDSAPATTAGSGYALTQTPPVPQRVALNDNVRSLVVYREERAGAARDTTRCGLQTALFDATVASSVVPAAIDAASDCRFYASAPETDFQRMRWVCAGAVNVVAGTLMQNVGLCPSAGATVRWDSLLTSCGTLGADRSASLSSMDEGIPGDSVTDLAATARLPSAVVISAPSTLPVTTWPASGDLVVQWSSSDATSALVRLEPDAASDPATTPTIICVAHTAGQVTVPAALITQGNFRTFDARLHVWSFRDGTTTAEGGRTYRVSGAASSSVVLQVHR